MKKEFNFALRNIKTEQFAFFESVFDNTSPIQIKGSVNFGINDVDHFIACTSHFEFLNNEKPFLAIQIICEFEVEATSWVQFINKQKTQIEFPVDILKHLISINIGISRGVVHSKTESIHPSFIFPLINLDALVKENHIYKFKKDRS